MPVKGLFLFNKSARKEAGHSLKSSIQHQYSFDTRNEQVFPSKGAYFKVLQELAGLGGDVQFLKNELHSQVLMELPHRMVLSLALRGGIMFALSEKPSTFPRANDRFYLGGPLSLRGFKYGGVGPRIMGNSLGGSAYNAVGIDFTFPLPYLPIDYIRGHLFFNSGSLVPIDSDNLAQNKFDFFKNPSSSIGFGIIARFTSFRFEANYCIPVRSTITDSLKPGVQFGVGMHFM
jgi:outer membrane protein insertion porin family